MRTVNLHVLSQVSVPDWTTYVAIDEHDGMVAYEQCPTLIGNVWMFPVGTRAQQVDLSNIVALYPIPVTEKKGEPQ